MIQNNKILTVSYGTFSCTLEGFDDSFDTMKAIAEYFRDLASDDRYFGAEPPVPDAEMLARIAQREISRKVEARRLDGGGFALRANEARNPEPDLTAEQAPETVVAVPAAEPDPSQETAMPEDAATNVESDGFSAAALTAQNGAVPWDAAQTTVAKTPDRAHENSATVKAPAAAPFGIAAFSSNEDEEAEAVLDGPTRGLSLAEAMAREDADIPEAEPYDPPAAEVDSIAAKLARIRAVVSRSETPLQAEMTVATDSGAGCDDVVPEDVILTQEDEDHATETRMSSPPEIESTETLETVAQIVPPTESIEPVAEDMQPIETEPTPEENVQQNPEAADVLVEEVEPTSSAEAEPANATEESMQDILNRLDRALANTSEELEDDQGDQASDMPDHTNGTPKESDGHQTPETWSVENETAETQDSDDRSDRDSEQETGAEPAEKSETLLVAEPGGSQAGTQAPVYFGPPEPDIEEPASKLADDDGLNADSATEQDAKAEYTSMHEDSGEEIAPCEDPSLRPHLFKLKRCEFEAALAAGGIEDVATTQETAADSAPLSELDILALKATDAEDSENEAGQPVLTGDPAGFEGEASLGDQPDSEDDIRFPEADDTEDPEFERLLTAAGSRLDDPENASTHETYKHLRGAVAATVAENAEAAAATDKSPEDAYRDDLASVVRPRRPTASSKGSDRSTSDSRPAPLQLVAEQRVDIDHAAKHRGPVRPRRIATDTQKSSEGGSANDGNFHEFANEMGATELPDLLEAAAAYLVYVEGRAQFSRPQVMNKVRQIKKTTYNREDGLRSFGRLVRDGKIEKTGGGRFTASGDIGFRPDEHVSG